LSDRGGARTASVASINPSSEGPLLPHVIPAQAGIQNERNKTMQAGERYAV
jgi:hypothetical protein